MTPELGLGAAAVVYGGKLDHSDPACWIWLGRAAAHGLPDSFFSYFSKQVEQYFSGSGNATVVFLIGRALKGNIDLDQKQIFGMGYCFDSRIGPANRAVSFYDAQIKSARLAVDAWTIVGIRLEIIKDVRKFIAKIIWDVRVEANYAAIMHMQVERKNNRGCFIQ